jgi:hypothetical protein
MKSATTLGFLTLFTFALLIEPCGSSIAEEVFPKKIGDTISFDRLFLKHERMEILFENGTLSLIKTEAGITGAGVVGDGKFSYETSENETPLQDKISGALLRFNPDDYFTFVQPANSRPVKRDEIRKESTDLIEQGFRLFFHKDDDAIFPDPGVLGAVLQTESHGNLVAVDGGAEQIVINLAERKYLFQSKEVLPVPIFKEISDNWVKDPFHVSMAAIWRREGIPVSGENYYYVPAPVPDQEYSRRFDPTSKYFQSWFGVYVLKPMETGPYGFENNKLVPRDFIQLGIADQRAWLRNAGFEFTKQAEIDTSFAIESMPTTISGKDAWRIIARIRSNADVGENYPKNRRVGYVNVPPTAWANDLNSYEPVLLEAVCYIVPDQMKNVTYVIYFNGVEFLDKSGQRHQTLPEIMAELEAMVSSVVF